MEEFSYIVWLIKNKARLKQSVIRCNLISIHPECIVLQVYIQYTFPTKCLFDWDLFPNSSGNTMLASHSPIKCQVFPPSILSEWPIQLSMGVYTVKYLLEAHQSESFIYLCCNVAERKITDTLFHYLLPSIHMSRCSLCCPQQLITIS